MAGLTCTCGETMEASCALPDHSAIEAFAFAAIHLRNVLTSGTDLNMHRHGHQVPWTISKKSALTNNDETVHTIFLEIL